MNRLAFRCSLPVLLFALSGGAYALGLGELRGQPSLGERFRLEVEILGDSKAVLDSACFHLIPPANSGDLPWLKKATLSVRKGSPSILEIRSDAPVREPVTLVAVEMLCGHDVAREYVVFASPPEVRAQPEMPVRSEGPALPVAAPAKRSQPVARSRSLAAPRPVDAPERLQPRVAEKRSVPNPMPDRLLLSTGEDVVEPSLRLATDLLSQAVGAGSGEATEAQREILRLEFRMLLAMNEQATNQLATAEKLRNMESTLGELQQRAADFSQRVEKDGQPAQPVAKPAPPVPAEEDAAAGISEWSLYGVALGAVLGLAGWIGWRKYRERQLDEDEAADYPLAAPDVRVDPKRAEEREESGVVDLAVEPRGGDVPMAVDLELDGGETPAVSPVVAPANAGEPMDSVLSISATTLDEHFEANPVMELADIMLSFGRVKGAAQALQEYIDNNPQEALQPWIRLMDVYRMAGMRNEFEAVSRNLNQNFNVEVQQWGGDSSTGSASLDLVLEDAPPAEALVPAAPKPECLEDMPRLMNMVCDQWASGDVVGYLYQLLRDNRGGQRVGFALPVVEEILFLIELKETAHRMEKDPGGL